MGGLRVAYHGRTIVLRDREDLLFGRANVEPGGRAGWGTDGHRFIELGGDPHIHRRWGRISGRAGVWVVANLGSTWPIRVVLPSGAAISLPPWTRLQREAGNPADELALTQQSFLIELTAGSSTWTLDCVREADGPTELDLTDVPQGRLTKGLGGMVAESITRIEFEVLWVMSTEYREATVGSSTRQRAPQPLSYSRIRRLLGLASTRQANAAVERLVRRFREGLLLANVDPEAQRDAICSIAVNQGMIEELQEKYGEPVASPPNIHSLSQLERDGHQ